MHHDNGPLGSMTIGRAEVHIHKDPYSEFLKQSLLLIPQVSQERRVELMKQNGYNAIRTSHNPPSPQVLRISAVDSSSTPPPPSSAACTCVWIPYVIPAVDH